VYGFYLVAVLIIIGGAIAYIGDRIGRHIGRRKLTLLGLRPKYTSVIITVITGICIVAASIGVMTWLSNDVRDALFHMHQIQKEYADNLEAYSESQKQLEELRYRVENQEEYLAGIIATKDAAKKESERLQKENAVLEEELLDLQHDLTQWKNQVVGMQILRDELQDYILKLEFTKEELQKSVSELTQQKTAIEKQMREGNFAFLKEEIVYDAVFQGGLPVEVLQRELLSFLEAAEEVALRKGAKIPDKEGAVKLAGEHFFYQTAQLLAESEGLWVVRAVATQNTVKGEPLLVYFHLFPDNEPLYVKGAVIGELMIDSSTEDTELILLDLLQQVQQDTLRQGMITQEGGSVGELAGQEYIDAIIELKRINGPAIVRIITQEDIRITQGPLKVNLQIQRVSG
jgi:hypothetical protein